MNNPKILLIEDDERLRKGLVLEFTERQYTVFEFDGQNEVLPFADLVFQYAVIDLRLKQANGLKFIPQIKTFSPECKIVVLTGYGSIATAVEAIKLGAINYLTKPIDIDVLEQALKGKGGGTENAENSEVAAFIPLSKQEHEYIEFVLAQNGGNISKTAKALGLHRQSLQRKLKKRP